MRVDVPGRSPAARTDLRGGDKTHDTACPEAVRPGTPLPEEDNLIETVAVGTDGSSTAGKAVRSALELAERYGARIVFISAYMPVDEHRLRRERRDAPQDIQWTINREEDVDATLREAEQLAEKRGLRWASEAAVGDPADVIVRLADKHKADVLVIGNRGMHRRVLGSVPNSVTHAARCSVYLVKTV
jgi:nucleotide-binding universal stress UspA family protein